MCSSFEVRVHKIEVRIEARLWTGRVVDVEDRWWRGKHLGGRLILSLVVLPITLIWQVMSVGAGLNGKDQSVLTLDNFQRHIYIFIYVYMLDSHWAK